MCPKIKSESRTVPVRFITEEEWRTIVAGMEIIKTAHWRSERQKIALAEEQDRCGKKYR